MNIFAHLIPVWFNCIQQRYNSRLGPVKSNPWKDVAENITSSDSTVNVADYNSAIPIPQVQMTSNDLLSINAAFRHKLYDVAAFLQFVLPNVFA